MDKMCNGYLVRLLYNVLNLSQTDKDMTIGNLFQRTNQEIYTGLKNKCSDLSNFKLYENEIIEIIETARSLDINTLKSKYLQDVNEESNGYILLLCAITNRIDAQQIKN